MCWEVSVERQEQCQAEGTNRADRPRRPSRDLGCDSYYLRPHPRNTVQPDNSLNAIEVDRRRLRGLLLFSTWLSCGYSTDRKAWEQHAAASSAAVRR